jgi:hypothetical protein
MGEEWKLAGTYAVGWTQIPAEFLEETSNY